MTIFLVDDPIPRPLPVEQLNCDSSKFYHQYGDACMPLNGPSMPAFSVSEVFGRPIRGNCPATNTYTSTSPLCVKKVREQNINAFHAKGGAPQTGQVDESGRACFDFTGIVLSNLNQGLNTDIPR